VALRLDGDFKRLLLPSGIVFCLLAMFAAVLFLMSRSTPWLVGRQHEPRWAWAVGSGRVKLWIAEPGVFPPDETWTASWYHGLDGQSIRWDFTLPLIPPAGIFVAAFPLWAVAAFLGIGGASLVLLGLRNHSGR
jgi:hypothetical protein